MPNKNYAEVMGHLGRNPETRITANGMSVTDLSVATSNNYKDRSGEWVEKPATWWKVSVWGELGDKVAVEFSKGDAVMVRGKVEARAWLSDSGEARVSHEITAREVFRPIYVSKAKDERDEQEPQEQRARPRAKASSRAKAVPDLAFFDEHSASLDGIEDSDVPF